MAGAERRESTAAGTASGGGAMPVEFEAFEEMSRSALRAYAGALTPEAVAGNSGHWITARDGIGGVLDRMRSAVEPLFGEDFTGAFPESVRAAHRAFVDEALALGEAVARPAGHLDTAAPRLGDVRTRVTGAVVSSGLDGFPGVYLFAEPSAELAALMESLYVPAVQEAVAAIDLPGPRTGDGAAAGAAGGVSAAADGAAEGAGHRGGAPAGDAAARTAGNADADSALEGAAGAMGPDVLTDASARTAGGPGPTGGQGAEAGTGRAQPGPSRPDAAPVDAAGHAAAPAPEHIGGARAGAGPGSPGNGPSAPSGLREGPPGAAGGAGPAAVAPWPRGRYSAAQAAPGGAAAGRAWGPPPGGTASGGAPAGAPVSRGIPAARAHGVPAAGPSAAQESTAGAARRPAGAGVLGAGGGRDRGESYESADFLTTLGHSDQLIGALGTVVHPVLGAAQEPR